VASIDGLGSGLDTTTIVSQLMAIERLPQTRLAQQRLSVLTQNTAWSGIDANLTSLTTAARTLTSSGALARATATSSNAAVGVTATAGAALGSHTLSVTRLATSQVVGSGSLASSTAPVGAGALVASRGMDDLGFSRTGTTTAETGTYTVEVSDVDAAAGTARITVDGTSYDVDTTAGPVEVAGLQLTPGTLKAGTAEVTVARTSDPDATVADLAVQLNSARGVASAAVVEVSPGSSRLLLSSTRTGTANDLTYVVEGLSGLGALSGVRAAADASLTFDGVPLTRSENTVTDLLPGATLTLSAPVGDVSLSVSADDAASTTAVQALFTSLNTVLSGLGAATRYDPATRTSGPLAGSSAARGLGDALRTLTSTTTTGGSGGTLAGAGVALQRDGTYAFDQEAFSAALAKDPQGVADLVAKVAAALASAATGATSTGGVVTGGEDASQSLARDLQSQVDHYEVRLTLTQARLTKQFAAMETALNKLTSQGTALSGQLASLPSWSGD